LTADGVPVLAHDAFLSAELYRRLAGGIAVDPAQAPAVRDLTLAQWRGYLADRNPDPRRFPDQDAAVTPLTRSFAGLHGLAPYSPPTLADLFAFAAAYAGDLGASVGKAQEQRARVKQVRFDLELKRVPFRPDLIGDWYAGEGPALLEEKIVEVVAAAGVTDRTTVRSFDHRAVRAVRSLEPRLRAAVLMAGTAPVAPGQLTLQAGAQTYCPDFEFLDPAQVRQCHAEGVSVVPWTVNDPADWERLLAWGVDGITTDYPDRLAGVLRSRGIPF
jgi:glycerophosphoryl diester phosphodiesterase